MASEDFLPVSRVTSPFRAATTEGNRLTHSVDRSPDVSRISWAYWCQKRRSASVRLKRSTMLWSLWMSNRPRQQLTDAAHKLAPRANLKKLRPLQGALLVNPSKGIGDLCRSLASQGLSLFVAACDVNDRDSITEDFPSYAVVWQEEQVGLMDLVWYRHVKFRPWYVLWSRQKDLPGGLLLEPVLGLLLSHLCCRRQHFDGCEPLPITSGTVVNVCKSGWQLFIWLYRGIPTAWWASNMRKPRTQESVQLCCAVLLRNKQQEVDRARKNIACSG